MATKDPTPPPPKKRLIDHQDAGLILDLAIRWRSEQIREDQVAEAAYAITLGSAIDRMVREIANPPTSPPPPRKK
jgi:hypothetical protein